MLTMKGSVRQDMLLLSQYCDCSKLHIDWSVHDELSCGVTQVPPEPQIRLGTQTKLVSHISPAMR